jgi:uncharacterized Zn finger protein
MREREEHPPMECPVCGKRMLRVLEVGQEDPHWLCTECGRVAPDHQK